MTEELNKQTGENIQNATESGVNYGEALRARIKARDKDNRVFDFIFTYIYPVSPLFSFLIEKTGGYAIILGLLLSGIPMLLGLLLFMVSSGGMAGRASIIGWLVMIFAFILVAGNKSLVIWILIIDLVLVYGLGYYQILRRK